MDLFLDEKSLNVGLIQSAINQLAEVRKLGITSEQIKIFTE